MNIFSFSRFYKSDFSFIWVYQEFLEEFNTFRVMQVPCGTQWVINNKGNIVGSLDFRVIAI